jgi:hypothetical protein
MKKRIFIVIITFIIILVNIYSEEGYIFGRILKENRCSHEGVKVKIFNSGMRLISQKETIRTGNFYFENIEIGRYFIEIDSGENLIKKEIIKNSKNIEVKFEKLNNHLNEFILYSFTYILYLLGFIVNIIILILLKKGVNIKGKKNIYISIYIFNFIFLFNIIAFIIGMFYESTISYFLPLSNMAGIFVPLFMYRFFMEYPVKRENKMLKSVYYIGFLIALFVATVEISKIYTRTEYIKIHTTDIAKKIYRLTYNLWDIELILLIGGVIFILIVNIKNYKNKIEGEISFICFKYGIAVFILILLGSCAVNRLWDIPFNNYIDLIYITSDILIFTGILTGIFGFGMLDKYKKTVTIFNEILKFVILISIYFVFKQYNSGEKIYIIPILLILKYILDFIFSFYLKINIIDKKNIKRKIENSFNFEMVEKEICESIKEKAGISRVIILTELNCYSDYNILKDKFKEEKERVIFIDKSDISKEYKKYKIGINMAVEGKSKGIILLGDKDNGKMICRKEIDFILDISEDGAYRINALMSFENRKEEIKGKTIAAKQEEREKKREAINYGISYAERIIQNIEDKDKVKKYSINLKSAMEELQKDDKDER